MLGGGDASGAGAGAAAVGEYTGFAKLNALVSVSTEIKIAYRSKIVFSKAQQSLIAIF